MQSPISIFQNSVSLCETIPSQANLQQAFVNLRWAWEVMVAQTRNGQTLIEPGYSLFTNALDRFILLLERQKPTLPDPTILEQAMMFRTFGAILHTHGLRELLLALETEYQLIASGKNSKEVLEAIEKEFLEHSLSKI